MASFAKIIHEGALPTGAQALAAVGRAFDIIAQGIKSDFEMTARTWGDKPNFVITGTDSAHAITRTIFASHPNYYMVNYGTRVRRAVMEKGFIAKTQPGVIGSQAGHGKMLFYNKNIELPGITARRFDLAIVKKWQPKVASIVNAELAKITKT